MKPDRILLSEQNRSQKDRHAISFICASYTFCVNRPIKSHMYMTWKYKKSCLEEHGSPQEGRDRTEDRVREPRLSSGYTSHSCGSVLQHSTDWGYFWCKTKVCHWCHELLCDTPPTAPGSQSLNSICFAGDNDSIPNHHMSDLRFYVEIFLHFF